MKKSLLPLFLLLAACVQAQVIPNSSFENWSLKDGGYLEPDGWVSANIFAQQGSPETCYPIETAHTGTYAMQLENRIDQVSHDTLSSFVILGSSYDAPGIAFPHHPSALGFYNMYNMKGDTAACLVKLSKWNTAKNKQDTVALGFTIFFDSLKTFKYNIIQLVYTQTGVMPDSATIIFISTVKRKALPGGTLTIDDIEFLGFTGIAPEQCQTVAKVYPNPAKNRLYIETQAEDATTEILDVNGRLLLSTIATEIDLSPLSAGIYLYRISGASTGSVTGRFVKE